MDRRRFSSISHAGMRFWNPLPVDALLEVLRELPLAAGSDVLDYGCGEGEVSLELVNRFGARITGVDPNPDAITRCHAKMAGRFLDEIFEAKQFAPRSFDLIVNIGASPGMLPLLEEVTPLLRQPGLLLVGDLYWHGQPSAELLTFLGVSSVPSLEDHQAALARAGFVMERLLLATGADWDRYEDAYDASMLAHLKAHPDDPDFEAFERRRRAWRSMYLDHARGKLGFALLQARRQA